ncbi:PepSY domain-containing protein [Phaeovulum sp.]|uniref:PepSY domain-containing protein n=1 Tax=Phaeovulum sp. TaxID=2934796 RepID=UPI0039E6A502
MKKTLTVLALIAAIPAGMAFADDDCSVPLANWQPRAAVEQLARDKGWTLRRIKIDDGCYEIKGRDATGREIKAKIDPATLRVIKMKYKDDDGDRDHRSRDRKNDAGALTPATPPDPLLGNGAPPKVQVK